jgi:hypothetical protein
MDQLPRRERDQGAEPSNRPCGQGMLPFVAAVVEVYGGGDACNREKDWKKNEYRSNRPWARGKKLLLHHSHHHSAVIAKPGERSNVITFNVLRFSRSVVSWIP